MNTINITIVQSDIIWEETKANLDKYESILNEIPINTDLIIFPEMFITGFSMDVKKIAQAMDGPGVAWIKKTSTRLNAHVVASLAIEVQGQYYNRLIWSQPDKQVFTYDKKHLFRMGVEHKHYTAGRCLLTVEIDGWRIRPFICYDLRFPGWIRNLENEYNMAIFIANWPQKRAHHWKALLTARAIENQCYVVGVNRVGQDGNDIKYSGDSCIIDFAGNKLVNLENKSQCISYSISRTDLDEYRNAFPVWQDADLDLYDRTE